MEKAGNVINLDLPLLDKSDPIWTAANGFVVRSSEGTTELVNGGHETFSVKVSGKETDGRLSLMEGEEPSKLLVFYTPAGAEEFFLILLPDSDDWK
ncbi:hypothetical protein [Micromonospora sp. NPDC004704]